MGRCRVARHPRVRLRFTRQDRETRRVERLNRSLKPLQPRHKPLLMRHVTELPRKYTRRKPIQNSVSAGETASSDVERIEGLIIGDYVKPERGIMPTTVKKIAEACGVSKATVRRRLEELGLNDDQHITVVGQKHLVSDYAASAVAASLSNHGKEEDGEPEQSTVEGMYERYIAVLEADKASLTAQIAEKDRLLAERDARIAELTDSIIEMNAKLADAQIQQKRSWWNRLLGRGGE